MSRPYSPDVRLTSRSRIGSLGVGFCAGIAALSTASIAAAEPVRLHGTAAATRALGGHQEDEFGWGGAASTHYWVSPRDRLIVVTMEQRWPYSPETEDALKPVIYGAIAK